MPVQTGPEPASLFQAINYTEFQEYVANTANEGYSKNLKIPSDLAAIDPAWSTCTPGMYGSWDPPRALTAAQNMVAPTPAQPALDPTATAAPAAGIAPTHVPATPTPPPKGPTSASLQPDSPTASADPGSESKEDQSNGNSDPAGSVGQAGSGSKGGNTGENPTPASNQGQDPDPANQQDDFNDTPSNDSSPKASPNSVVLASPPPLIVGGNTIEKAPQGGAVIGESTFTAGYQGQTSGMPISVGVDKILLGTTTHALPTSAPVLIGGNTMVKADNGGVVIGTSTYPPGSQAQISDTALSVGVDSVVVGSTSYAIPAPGTANTVLIDQKPISRAPNGGAIFEGVTIGLGSQSSIDGHAFSVGASTVVVDGTSYALPSSAGAVLQSPYPPPNAPITLINGAVLTPGDATATISGTTYTIPSDDTGLVVNGQTVQLPTETALQSVFTVAGQIFTATPTGFAIGGQSVALDGTAATLNGTVVSLRPSGVQIGSTTMPLTSAQTTEPGLGRLIMSGFGSGGEPGATAGSGNGSNVLAFTGDSSRVGKCSSVVYLGTVGMVVAVVALSV